MDASEVVVVWMKLCSGVVGLSNVKLRRVRLAAKGSVLQRVLLIQQRHSLEGQAKEPVIGQWGRPV
jgi:hypothetical protein